MATKIRDIVSTWPGVDKPVSSAVFSLVISLLFALFLNYSVLGFAFTQTGVTFTLQIEVALTVFALIFLCNSLFFGLLSIIHSALLAPAAYLSLLVSSFALFFHARYGVVFDRTMMGNIYNTNASEMADFLQPSLLIYLSVFFVLPAVAVSKIKIYRASALKMASYGVGSIVFSCFLIMVSSNSWLWIDRNASRLGSMIFPWSLVINSARYYDGIKPVIYNPLPDVVVTREGPAKVVLVIGETARAQNIPFYGYHRNTMPLLGGRMPLVFKDTNACSTYTTASLECILAKGDPAGLGATQTEFLPDFLQRNGIPVDWRSNNWGNPVFERVPIIKNNRLNPDCDNSLCQLDTGLLSGLANELSATREQKGLVVLHQNGSHGPAYAEKYPAEFARYLPACDSVDLSSCTPESLVNSYDNSLLFTDYFLDSVITLLQAMDTPALLIYVSDHGESLGEGGLFLHGTPYTIAPDVQKKIPLFIWMNPAYRQWRALSIAEIPVEGEFGQHNIFPTVLGALGLGGDSYEASLDLLNGPWDH